MIATWTKVIDDTLAGYVHNGRRNRRAVLFVHGLTGHFVDTWGERRGVAPSDPSLIKLVADDPELADFDVFTFGYRTTFSRGDAISIVSRQLADALEHPQMQERDIVLVAHSMGGLACMRYVLNQLEARRRLPIVGMVMYGTPTTGTELVKYARTLSLAVSSIDSVARGLVSLFWGRHRELEDLAVSSDFLRALHDQWAKRVVNGGHPSEPDAARRAFLPVRVITGTDDWIVPEQSAKGVYGDIDWHPITHSHTELVKPASASDRRYFLLSEFLRASRHAKAPDKLAQIRAHSDAVWATHRGKMIRNWRFGIELDVSTAGGDTLKPCRVSSSYEFLLEDAEVVVGVSYGNVARTEVWRRQPEPSYVHQIRVDLVPEPERSRVAAALDALFQTPGGDDERWAALFPEMEVRIDGHVASAGRLEPGTPDRKGWLCRTFEVPNAAKVNRGHYVRFELSYASVAPAHLASFTIFFPWLVDGCACRVDVDGNVQSIVHVKRFSLNEDVSVVQDRSGARHIIHMSTNGLVLPQSALDVHWVR